MIKNWCMIDKISTFYIEVDNQRYDYYINLMIFELIRIIRLTMIVSKCNIFNDLISIIFKVYLAFYLIRF